MDSENSLIVTLSSSINALPTFSFPKYSGASQGKWPVLARSITELHTCGFRSRQSSPSNGKYLGILQARGLPPIHFGKEDGVERTLLRVACQGETIFSFTLAGRCHSTHFCGTVAAKMNLTKMKAENGREWSLFSSVLVSISISGRIRHCKSCSYRKWSKYMTNQSKWYIPISLSVTFPKNIRFLIRGRLAMTLYMKSMLKV